MTKLYTCSKCATINYIDTQYRTIGTGTAYVPVAGSVCTRCEATVNVVWSDALAVPVTQASMYDKIYYFPGTYT